MLTPSPRPASPPSHVSPLRAPARPTPDAAPRAPSPIPPGKGGVRRLRAWWAGLGPVQQDRVLCVVLGPPMALVAWGLVVVVFAW